MSGRPNYFDRWQSWPTAVFTLSAAFRLPNGEWTDSFPRVTGDAGTMAREVGRYRGDNYTRVTVTREVKMVERPACMQCWVRPVESHRDDWDCDGVTSGWDCQDCADNYCHDCDSRSHNPEHAAMLAGTVAFVIRITDPMMARDKFVSSTGGERDIRKAGRYSVDEAFRIARDLGAINRAARSFVVEYAPLPEPVGGALV